MRSCRSTVLSRALIIWIPNGVAMLRVIKSPEEGTLFGFFLSVTLSMLENGISYKGIGSVSSKRTLINSAPIRSNLRLTSSSAGALWCTHTSIQAFYK